MITRCTNCGCEDLEVVEYGPELPELIYASDGAVWGRHGPSSGMWWYGSTKAVMWEQLVRMARGEQAHESDVAGHLIGQFPWGPWVGANYGADHQAILDRLGVA